MEEMASNNTHQRYTAKENASLINVYIKDTINRSRKRRKNQMQRFVQFHSEQHQGTEKCTQTPRNEKSFLPEISVSITAPRRTPEEEVEEEEEEVPRFDMSLPRIGLELEEEQRQTSGGFWMESRTSDVDTLLTGRLHRMRRRKELGAKFRRLAHFLSVLFGLWRNHAKRVKHFMDTNVDLLEVHQLDDLLFDVTEFRADKQARVSEKTRRILNMRPSERTQDECRHVQISLGNYPSIAEYPLRMTRLMAKRAWYERYEAKRVIVRQGHPARCYYFILNGSVVITRMEKADGLSRTVCFLKRGESFGDLGLVSNAPRQATVISKEPLELLVFDDNDYVDIFMSGGLRDPSNPFLNSVFFLKGWPLDLLPQYPNMAILNYFKRGMTLVHDSNFSDWLYIIKSGSCNILKKLKNVKPASRLRIAPVEPTHRIRLASLSDTQHELLIERNLRLAELRSQQQSQHMRMATCYELGVAIRPVARPPPGTRRSQNPIKEVAKINEEMDAERESVKSSRQSSQQSRRLSGPFITKSTSSKNEPTTPDDAANSLKNLTLMRSRAKKARPKASNGKKTVSDEFNVKFLSSDLHRTDADFNPAFVRIQTLTKGCEFGLAHLMHDNQPSFSLVSNGAECILINKKFYLDNVDKHLMNALRMKVCPYPSDDELQSFLQVHVDWQDSRTTVIADSLRRNREKKIDINDARSITQSY